MIGNNRSETSSTWNRAFERVPKNFEVAVSGRFLRKLRTADNSLAASGTFLRELKPRDGQVGT